jgi:hypothetical protein
MTIDKDNQLRLYELETEKEILSASHISWAKFLDNGNILMEKKGIIFMVRGDGYVTSDVIVKSEFSEIPHISPKQRFIYFTSDDRNDFRLRFIYDLKLGRTTTIRTIDGDIPVLLNPKFIWDDSKIVCTDYLVDPISGVARKRSYLEDYNGKNLSVTGGYLVVKRGGKFHIIDVKSGREKVGFSFPREFHCKFVNNPEYFFLKRKYE